MAAAPAQSPRSTPAIWIANHQRQPQRLGRLPHQPPKLYAMANTAFREISAPPGPANNSFSGITGYPASKVWNACTGLGSIDGTALQTGLKTAAASNASPAQDNPPLPPTASAPPALPRPRSLLPAPHDWRGRQCADRNNSGIQQ